MEVLTLLPAWFAALPGLLIGSFLNVCIYRLPRDLSVVRPRSHCPYCEQTVAWYDNIPLLSYVLLRGRCRHCGTPYGWVYPMVEALTALAFVVAVLQYGWTLAALKWCCFAAIMITLACTDLFEERILPDEFTLGGAVLGLVFSPFVPLTDSPLQIFLDTSYWQGPRFWMLEAAVGAAIPAFLLWGLGTVYMLLRGKEALGLGDVKMLMTMGAFLGLMPCLGALVIASLLGTAIGVAWIVWKKEDFGSYELPFGTFLAAASLIVVFWINRPAA
jgi:leader peptidase (prepilin peptidase) / N-methyltransferase